MPTYPQLQSEVWWIREYQPPSLAELCRRLREHFQVSAGAIGSKGDNNHLYGYHRSAAWVLNSVYCTNDTYSVSETPGNRNPGDVNWLCAVDITVPADELIPMCQRLDTAVRAGTLEKITEWYGNDDGDNRVDGYNNVRNVVASSDDSHLWHLHLSFDRGRAGEDHSDLFAVLTGVDMPLTAPDLVAIWTHDLQDGPGEEKAYKVLLRSADGVTELLSRPAGTVTLTPEDRAAIVADLLAALTPEIRDAVADLGEGGAKQVRADA